MISIRNLYKRYHNHHGSHWVLEDVNIDIPAKVSVGLIGRNGAGKSTLLRLIGGMDAPEKGEIIRDCRVSWPIGLTGGFQGSMTGRQNVKFVARIHGGNKLIDHIIAQVQDFAEIGDAFDEPVSSYSSGMRARLAFGLSLAFDFDVYLSDEATAVGDMVFRKKAEAAFKERIGQSSLIIVSHAEGILTELCQAGILLDRGKATWFDDINDALATYHQNQHKALQEIGKEDLQQKDISRHPNTPCKVNISAERLDSILSANVDTADLLRELAYSLLKNGELTQALVVIERAQALRPSDTQIQDLHKQLRDMHNEEAVNGDNDEENDLNLDLSEKTNETIKKSKNKQASDYKIHPKSLEAILSPKAQLSEILRELAFSLEASGDIVAAYAVITRALEENPDGPIINALHKRIKAAVFRQ